LCSNSLDTQWPCEYIQTTEIEYKARNLEQEFYELQRQGARIARKKGILTEKDVEKIVFEGR